MKELTFDTGLIGRCGNIASGLSTYMDEVAKRVMAETDALLKQALTAALGTSEWAPESIAGRVNRVVRFQDKTVEFITLDGDPIMAIDGYHFSHDVAGKMTCSVKYKMLGKAERSKA